MGNKHRWWIGGEGGNLYSYRNSNDLWPGWWFFFAVLVAVLVVGAIAVSRADAEEIPVETIAREASNQPFEAQVAVAEVIKTRMAERRQTAEQVCLAKRQFSCWDPGVRQTPRTVRELATARRAWEQAKATGANLYHDNSVRPYWAKKVRFVKRIGRLIFYREERGA